jgi:hypothetical protein
MFANCTAGGMNQAAGDVCLTPAPPAPPVPVPYVNISQNAIAVNTFTKLIICGGTAINLASQVPVSSGDEPGSVGGVASGTIVGMTKFITGSAKVIWGGQPATRLTSTTTQNSNNCVGSTISPSQTKVILLG